MFGKAKIIKIIILWLFIMFIQISNASISEQAYSSSVDHLIDNNGYYDIAIGFAKIKNFKSALKYAKKNQNVQSRDLSYSIIIKSMLEEKLDNEALKVIKYIVDKNRKMDSSFEIIKYEITVHHDYEKANMLSEKYLNDMWKRNTKNQIIRDMIQRGEIDNAVSFFENNPDKTKKGSVSYLFRTVVDVFLQREDINGMQKFIKKANIKIDDEYIDCIITQARYLGKYYLVKDMIEEMSSKKKDMHMLK